MSQARVEQLSGITPVSASRATGTVARGAGSGLAAGGAMAVVLVAAALLSEVPALTAFQAIGGVVPGLAQGGPSAVVAGVLLHALVSAALGVAFSAVVPGDFPSTSSAGVGVGFALFAMGFSASVLPAAFVRDLHDLGGAWVVAHAVYGVVLGLAVAGSRRRSSVQKPPG